jgi:hypothetical protein
VPVLAEQRVDARDAAVPAVLQVLRRVHIISHTRAKSYVKVLMADNACLLLGLPMHAIW